MKSPLRATIALALLFAPTLHAGEPAWPDLEQQFDTLPMATRRFTGPMPRRQPKAEKTKSSDHAGTEAPKGP
ncbi:MAG: hypothetical protein WCS43_07415 [Verrucomicrobiota bacterium]